MGKDNYLLEALRNLLLYIGGNKGDSRLKDLLFTKRPRARPAVAKPRPKKKTTVLVERTKPKLDNRLVFISSKNPMPPVTHREPINWG